MRWILAVIGLLLSLTGPGRAQEVVTLNSNASRLQGIAGWLPKTPQGLGPLLTDRTGWQKLAQHPAWQGVVRRAEATQRKAIPQLTDDLYLDFSRTGNRVHYEWPYGRIQDRLKVDVLAECLEHQGRFVADIEKIIAILCDLPSWTMPAHDGNLKSFHRTAYNIDLGASSMAWTLATADYLLGDTLSPQTRALIRGNLQTRIFTPMRAQIEGTLKRQWWFTTTNNWNAVCLANVTGAALAALPDRQDRAFFVRTAEQAILNVSSMQSDADQAKNKPLEARATFQTEPNTARSCPVPTGTASWPQRTWFNQAGVLIDRPGKSRTCRMAMALKGGNNAEHHNHNDVGSYIVVVDGKLILTDPGSEVYTARTFSSHRYDSDAMNSFGHSVPLIAGTMQRTGRQARAHWKTVDFSDTEDHLVMDITSAYHVPSLQQVTRDSRFSRSGAGRLTITDQAAFTQPETFETCFITFEKVTQTGPNQWQVTKGPAGVTIDIDTRGDAYDVISTPLKAHFRAKRTPIRWAVRLKEPTVKAFVRLTMTPGPKD